MPTRASLLSGQAARRRTHPTAGPPGAHRLRASSPPLLGPPRPACSRAHQRGLLAASAQAPHPGAPGRRPPLLGVGALHPGRPEGRRALRPWGLRSLPSGQGLPAARRPLPARPPGPRPRLGPPGPVPAGPSFEPPWIADPLRASRRPLSARPCRSSPSERPRALPALPVGPSLHRLGIEARPSSLRPPRPRAVRQASAPLAFRPLPPAPSLTPQSNGLPSPIGSASGGSRHPGVSGT